MCVVHALNPIVESKSRPTCFHGYLVSLIAFYMFLVQCQHSLCWEDGLNPMGMGGLSLISIKNLMPSWSNG
jgi:hypothetical protein